MNAAYPMFGAILLMFLGYRFYSKFLAVHIFQLDDSNPTPAHTLEDGIDYVPTRKAILFNHHFASITGLSPMLGPALAVIWGWLPATLWLIFGAVMMGCVHDFAALVLSVRHKGKSIGVVAHTLLGKRARILFLFLIFFGVSIAMGIFVAVIAALLKIDVTGPLQYQTYPEAAFPAAFLMLIALAAGILMRYNLMGLISVSILGTVLTLLSIAAGVYLPIKLTGTTWIYVLLAYGFLASVLPVWILLQPRDFINSFTLYIGLFLLYLSVTIFGPPIVAPAINHDESLPSMIPLLFVTIACGSISGFHSLVSSGTTAKQLYKESDARPIGYGGMLMECLLGVIAVIACTAGMDSNDEWVKHYRNWSSAQGMGPTLSVFVQGAGKFIHWLGVPNDLAVTFVALVVVSFALTTLDTATRILRYNVEEIGETFNISFLGNRYISSTIAVVSIWYFATSSMGTSLWTLFGTTNQLLAGLALLAATVYLVKNKRPTWVTALPMVFMLLITLTAMGVNLYRFFVMRQYVLIVVGAAILLLSLGLISEAIRFFLQRKKLVQET